MEEMTRRSFVRLDAEVRFRPIADVRQNRCARRLSDRRRACSYHSEGKCPLITHSGASLSTQVVKLLFERRGDLKIRKSDRKPTAFRCAGDRAKLIKRSRRERS